MSAQASDMSAWLLMGLPGSILAFGFGQMWIGIGLAIGTAANWIICAARLRKFSKAAGDAITLPQYLTNRFMSMLSYRIRPIRKIGTRPIKMPTLDTPALDSLPRARRIMPSCCMTCSISRAMES
jgi:Na+(H+)/acetate symporter ActP